MGRNKIYKNGREEVGGYLHPKEFEAFEEIRWRERKGKTEIVRKAVLDYISAHKDGNDTYKLTNWNEDPSFKAVPTILSRSEIWYKYLEECTDNERVEIRKRATSILKQCQNIESLK